VLLPSSTLPQVRNRNRSIRSTRPASCAPSSRTGPGR
jgi:hypothetical protein